jgi:hypothetical protein
VLKRSLKKTLNKILKSLSLLPILILSTLPIFAFAPVASVSGAPLPTLSISPALINDSCSGSCTHNVGAQFQYNVSITGIGGTSSNTMFAYQFSLTYDAAVLQALNISSYGPFFDALISGGNAITASSIDNTNGAVTVAVSSLGPSTTTATTHLLLGSIWFSVAGRGISYETLTNVIVIHNSGGGVIANLAVTTVGAVFTNSGLVGKATWPANLPYSQWAYPETTGSQSSFFPVYNYTADTSFTPGCLDFFANVNSTGTLAVMADVQFTVVSLTSLFSFFGHHHQHFAPVTVTTPVQEIAAATFFPVPLHTCWSPTTSTGTVLTGFYIVIAQINYQQVNLDNSLGQVRHSFPIIFFVQVVT